jgi:hypothetical protein
MKILPTFGISAQFEIDLDARLPEDPLAFASDASKAGLYIQFFIRDHTLWARVAGPLDTVLDFQSTL